MSRPAYLFSRLVALATAPAQADYHPIQPRAQTPTIRLHGSTLSVDAVVQVAQRSNSFRKL